MRITLITILLCFFGCDEVGQDSFSPDLGVAPRPMLVSAPKQRAQPTPPTASTTQASLRKAADLEKVQRVKVPFSHPNPLLMTRQEEEDIARFFPTTEFSSINNLKTDPYTLYYNDRVMPPVYQVWDRGNQSGLRLVEGGQVTANKEAHWANPAGLSAGSNFRAVGHFVRMIYPMLWWREVSQGGRFLRYNWEYQQGTTFGEILAERDSTGNEHTFLMRIRAFHGGETPKVDQFMPVPDRERLEEALESRGVTQVPSSQLVVQSIDTRLNPFSHRNNALVASGIAENLPLMSESLVTDLLHGEIFKSTLGKPFDVVQGTNIEAATSSQAFSLVPQGFLGSLVPTDRESCIRCHQDAGRIVNLQDQTRWRIRGGGGIFTFHIFDPDAIAQGQLQLNRRLVEAGLLAHKDGMP